MKHYYLEKTEQPEASLGSYVAGYLISLLLIGGAYTLVTQHILSGSLLVGALVVLAIVQLIAQLIFFMHLNQIQSRWKLGVFLFMLLVISILVFGTLWIMNNLNYRMSPDQVNQYMSSQDAF